MPKPQQLRSRSTKKQSPDLATPDTPAAVEATAESQPPPHGDVLPRASRDPVEPPTQKAPLDAPVASPTPQATGKPAAANSPKRVTAPKAATRPASKPAAKPAANEKLAQEKPAAGVKAAQEKPAAPANVAPEKPAVPAAEAQPRVRKSTAPAKAPRVTSKAADYASNTPASPEPTPAPSPAASAAKPRLVKTVGPRPAAGTPPAAPKAVEKPTAPKSSERSLSGIVSAVDRAAEQIAKLTASAVQPAPAAPDVPPAKVPGASALDRAAERIAKHGVTAKAAPPIDIEPAVPAESQAPTARPVERVAPEVPAAAAVVKAAPLAKETAPSTVEASEAQPVVKDETPAPVSETKPSTPSVALPAPVAPPSAAAEPPAATPPTAITAATSSGSGRALRILMIASEAVPFAKTGGLADVAGALPVALGRLGHEVTLVLPRYRGVAVQGAPVAQLHLLLGQEWLQADVYEAPLGRGARAWLIDTPSLYDREGGLYNVNGADHVDNPKRFAFLTRAAFEAARTVGFSPDIVHAHDWQGGLAPVYLKTAYAQDPVFGGVPCVFTIHNLAYTGTFDPAWLPALDLGWDLFRPESLEYWSRISFLKAGINFSAKVTTVSPTYAREILTPEFAYGFEGILAARRADLVGILNGIDADTWNPATDPFIPKTFAVDDLSGKRDAKRALLKAYSLPWDDDALDEPLIGMVSRMIDQKGLDLIASIAHELPTLGARFVVLGTGEPRYEAMWRSLADHYPDRVAVRVGFDEPLSHLVEAGSDLFLMPSHYEPCGLNQMYSLRYGTLPVVRATGGLDDTVENYDPYTGRGNGFKFWEPSGLALLGTLRWALRVYENPEVWQRLQRAGMRLDFSWSRSAGEYARLYVQTLAAAGRTVGQAARVSP